MTDGGWYWGFSDGGGMVCRDCSVAQILSLPLWTQSSSFSPRIITLKPLVPYFSPETNNIQALYHMLFCLIINSHWSHSVCPRKQKIFRVFRLCRAFRVSLTFNVVFYSDVTVTRLRLNFFSGALFLSISPMPFDLAFGLGELRKSLAHKASSVLI